MDAGALEAVLVGPDPERAADRAAHAGGRWSARLAARCPPPSRLAFIRYSAWLQAQRRAEAIGYVVAPRKAIVFPIWRCATEDAASDAWARATVVAFEDGAHEVIEIGAPADAVVFAVVDVARVAYVGPAQGGAPGVPERDVPYRNPHYLVAVGQRLDRLERIERVIDVPGAAAPRREVAPHTVDTALAIAVGDLDIADFLDRVVKAAQVGLGN